MRAIVLLAHSGHLDQNGTVHALGLGWTTSPTPTAQHVLIVFVEVEWSELGASFPIRAELVDSDGRAGGPHRGEHHQGPPAPGAPGGHAGHHSVHCDDSAAELKVGERYQWRVSIADEMHEDWLAGFTVTE